MSLQSLPPEIRKIIDDYNKEKKYVIFFGERNFIGIGGLYDEVYMASGISIKKIINKITHKHISRRNKRKIKDIMIDKIDENRYVIHVFQLIDYESIFKGETIINIPVRVETFTDSKIKKIF